MDRYVDGFVLAVPESNIAAYREMASAAGDLWIEHGALEYMECVGDDLNPHADGSEIATFPDLVATSSDETVIFAFIVFKSRAHRDAVNEAVMASMDSDEDAAMPFDMSRMAWGGFRSIVAYDDRDTVVQ